VRRGCEGYNPWYAAFEFFAASEEHCPTGLQDRETVTKLVEHVLYTSSRQVGLSTTSHAEHVLFWMEQWRAIREGGFVSLMPLLLQKFSDTARARGRGAYDPPKLEWEGWHLASLLDYDEAVTHQFARQGSTRLPGGSARALKVDWQRTLEFCCHYESLKDQSCSELLFTILYLGGRLQVKLKKTGLI
jgi:hypothetical protein